MSDDHHTLKGTFQTSTFFQMHAMGGSRGGTGGSDPPENHKNIGFPSNIDPDPLNMTKLPSQHSMVGRYRQWRFADGPMVVQFRWHADECSTLNAGFAAAIFPGIRTCIARKPYILVIFQGGEGGSDLYPHM